MEEKVVYQTIEDRNADYTQVEENGPIICDHRNSWLGDGYYFWDTFIENAHWWGKKVKVYRNGYLICKALCDFDDKECFDLVGNTEHLKKFHEAYSVLKEEGYANNKIMIRGVFVFLKKQKSFHFKAIRACGQKSKNYKSEFSNIIHFDHNAYMDTTPPIQICFFTKNSLNLREYRVVYPPENSIQVV